MMLEFNDFALRYGDEDAHERFARMPFADLLCVWDCYAGTWTAGAPVLMRFEDDDVLVTFADNCAFMTIGAIDTTDAGALPRLLDAGEPDGDACLCWRRCGLLDDFIGERCNVLQLLAVLLERGAKSRLFLNEV